MPVTLNNLTVAEAYLRLLKLRGIDYLFANAGTDFAPIIEAFASAGSDTNIMPEPILVPHENVAVAMAMGHTLVSGKPQAVMVHVNVGTANALCGIMNANRIQIPMLFTAGRTPILEEGAPGARSGFIHWPQEMYDQGGIVREMVRWDYELRDARQLEAVVDRALAMSGSTPAGPVYLTLPREVLAEKIESITFADMASMRPVVAGLPPSDALDEVAEWLSEAKRPVLVTSATGRTQAALDAVQNFAETFAIPVIPFNPRFVEISHDHPMNMGADLGKFLPDADLVFVSEAIAPWIPSQVRPGDGARIVHIGEDPLFGDLPMRSFAAHGTLAGAPAAIFRELIKRAKVSDTVEIRRAKLHSEKVPTAFTNASDPAEMPTPRQVTQAIARICKGALMFKESPALLDDFGLDAAGQFFFAGAAGGLGWSMGAAMGASLANGRQPVVVTVGDGSYMFNTPLAAHHVAASQAIPMLTVIYNNCAWHAVRRSTHGMYPSGHAKAAPREPLTDFGVDFDYVHMMDVAGGYGERVDRFEQLVPALERAMANLQEGRQALLDVRIAAGRK
ncbi:thiamine pyrophosphate-requiring protein [Pelagibacterium luteolum]|uniref:Acetolactate synthase-1/2/3 large subunit n=1 Tax=Pelagibacterium luteolum TaxID=440168 RepID=A0A1G7SXK3_9HYPH|nr:thiamine pyrophosphate-requiring protein [Pelagibacterium luteolum]SDG27514.1 acetolactate synthase-1/2/3 large subunit [Pelagibacterium luteolum]